MPRKCLVLDFFRGIGVIPPIPTIVLPWLVCRSLAVVNWCPLSRTLWIGSEEGNPDFYASAFFLVSFVDLQMHIVIIFVLITSVVVYFCGRLPADPKYLDVLKTRVHSILCRLLNLITDYYFGSSSSSIIGTIKWRCSISWWLDAITLSLYFVWVGNVCSCETCTYLAKRTNMALKHYRICINRIYLSSLWTSMWHIHNIVVILAFCLIR